LVSLPSRVIYPHGLRGISGICGGICAATFIAQGVMAAKEMAIKVPLILAQSGLEIVADNLADAATKIMDEVKKAE
jgi:hypothetical protein